METTANVTIHLQALGGKFLGPNAYKTDSIKLSVTVNDDPSFVTYKLGKNVNDGGIGPSFLSSLPSTFGLTSFLPILTPDIAKPTEPTVNYLTPNNLTISGSAEVKFSAASLLGTVKVSIPRPQGDDLVLTQSIALNHLQTNYRVIMIVPGLLLELPKPPPPLPNAVNTIYVYVRMMCGCPITTPTKKTPQPFWLPNDFLVSAEVILRNGLMESHSVTFTSDATPSLFQLVVNDLSDVRRVNFTARQKSTGNIGYYSVEYPV